MLFRGGLFSYTLGGNRVGVNRVFRRCLAGRKPVGWGVLGLLDNFYINLFRRSGRRGGLPGVGVWVWVEGDAGLRREVNRVVGLVLPVFGIVVSVSKVDGVLRVLGDVVDLRVCCRSGGTVGWDL